MTKLTKESAMKLQRILSKRFNRQLSDQELEQAYEALMGFAEALIDLDTPEMEPTPKPPVKNHMRLNHPIANHKESIIQYV